MYCVYGSGCLCQEPQHVGAMRDDALAGGHHVVQGVPGQDLGQAAALKSGLRRCVDEVDVPGQLLEGEDHRQFIGCEQLIAVPGIVARHPHSGVKGIGLLGCELTHKVSLAHCAGAGNSLPGSAV